MYKIVKINPVIFRGYDLRGVVGEDLTEDSYYTLGRGYATYLSKFRILQVTVGRDNRLTSKKFSDAFIAGLLDSGVDAIDLGLSLSQIVYFSAYYFQTKGSAMVTASHNPKNFNGLKLGTSYSETMVTDEIQTLRKICEKQEFVTGKGSMIEQDIFPAYAKSILKHFHLQKKWKVVVEACNTTSGMFYPEIFRQAGCEVIEQNCELDGNFPLGVPDPTEVEVLDRLAAGVKKHQADIGFAYDTDGDRMAVVDEKGQVLWMDTIVALFAKDVLEFIPGAKIVYNTLCSRQVTEAIESAGGEPVVWLTGHSFIKAKVKEIKAPFGGELSGHIFFMDNFFGHDDGAFASMRLLAYLERHNHTLSQEVSELSSYVSSPEIKFGLADAIKFKFVDTEIRAAFMKHWPNAKYIDIDGIRMDTDSSMATIRASQNGPYITLKFEAKTQTEYDLIKSQLKEMLSQYNEIDWNQGVNTHALE
ncbi:phosphomannomutase/phosphoglucomutase [Candidatus Woesebacteria bacterium]|nr:phosphomannomutase/phosphoglucomutase [Candidatus Woesebacteria bacterium]